MDRAATDAVTRALLAQINRLLSEASSIARAAEVCADSGNVTGAVRMVMDIEDPAYRADHRKDTGSAAVKALATPARVKRRRAGQGL